MGSRKDSISLVNFTDGGRWLVAKECWQPSDAKKGKKMDTTLTPQRELSPADALILAQWEL